MEDHRKYFEVGKKYYCDGSPPRLIVGFDSRGRAILEMEAGVFKTVSTPSFWKEHKEPVVLKKYVAVIKGPELPQISSQLWSTEEAARTYHRGSKFIDVIEIKWTEKL